MLSIQNVDYIEFFMYTNYIKWITRGKNTKSLDKLFGFIPYISIFYQYYTICIYFRLRDGLPNEINSYSRLKICVMLGGIYNFKSLRLAFKTSLYYKITFWICGFVLRMQMLSRIQKI